MFLRAIGSLSDIFAKADGAALEKALQSGDLQGACTALHTKRRTLTALLRRGAIQAGKIAQDDPGTARSALKTHRTHRRKR